MILDDFKQIALRIEDLFRAAPGGHKFSELEFEDWWQSFQGEDADVVNEAVTLMKEEYGYFPMVVTLKTYVEKTQGHRRKREEEAALARQAKKFTPEEEQQADRLRISWFRFFAWCRENREWPNTRKHPESPEEMKAKFEKEHPNWKPKPKRKEQARGMRRIGDVLRDSDVFP